jgi:probable rRNA maturation factor
MSDAEDKYNLSIRNLTKGKALPLPFVKIKQAILGNKYDLSIVLCGDALSHRLNRIYRGKDKPTNVLSFPLSKQKGEIFLNLPLLKREARTNDLSFMIYTSRMLIHGLLHLKGMEHGATMEQAEQKFFIKFNI